MNVPVDISHITLSTDRLTLRAWTLEDLDDFHEYASEDGVGQAAGWIPHFSRDISLTVLRKFIEGKNVFAIESDGKVIGSVGIEEYDEKLFPERRDERGRELGYVLSKKYWGQGLMTEAIRVVIDYLFDALRLDFIVCGYFPDNVRSMRVQQKCGFRPCGLTEIATELGKRECVMTLLEREERVCED